MRNALPVLAACLCGGTAGAAEWKPAPSPLMTDWGKKVSPQNVWPDYPRPQLVRERWQSLNGLWDYAVTAANAARPDSFAGQILVPFCIESALSGVGGRVTPHEALWYRRSFKIPAEWSRQRVLLHFDAVDWQTEIDEIIDRRAE